MALLSLLFGGPKKAQIGVMRLDASVSETHDRTAVVTQNEVEDGTNVADHIKLQPIGLTIEGLISDVPLSLFGSALGLAGGFATSQVQNAFGGGGSVGGALAAQAAALGIGSVAGLVLERTNTDKVRNPQDAFRYLEELWENRLPFEVITVSRTYQNMVISNLSIPKNAQIGKGLRFTVTMEQVRIVSSTVVQVPFFLAPNVPGASTSAKTGKQSAKEAKPSTQARSTTILRDGFQRLFGG